MTKKPPSEQGTPPPQIVKSYILYRGKPKQVDAIVLNANATLVRLVEHAATWTERSSKSVFKTPEEAIVANKKGFKLGWIIDETANKVRRVPGRIHPTTGELMFYNFTHYSRPRWQVYCYSKSFYPTAAAARAELVRRAKQKVDDVKGRIAHAQKGVTKARQAKAVDLHDVPLFLQTPKDFDPELPKGRR